jgi:hypothetical protein
MIATPTAASCIYRFLSVAFAALPRTAFALAASGLVKSTPGLFAINEFEQRQAFQS